MSDENTTRDLLLETWLLSLARATVDLNAEEYWRANRDLAATQLRRPRSWRCARKSVRAVSRPVQCRIVQLTASV